MNDCVERSSERTVRRNASSSLKARYLIPPRLLTGRGLIYVSLSQDHDHRAYVRASKFTIVILLSDAERQRAF